MQVISQLLLSLFLCLQPLQTSNASLHDGQQRSPHERQLTRKGTCQGTCGQMPSTHKHLHHQKLLVLLHSPAGVVL